MHGRHGRGLDPLEPPPAIQSPALPAGVEEGAIPSEESDVPLPAAGEAAALAAAAWRRGQAKQHDPDGAWLRRWVRSARAIRARWPARSWI